MKLTKEMQAKLRKLCAKVKPCRDTELNEIAKAMTKAKGDKVLAAALLGIGQTTIYHKLGKRRH